MQTKCKQDANNYCLYFALVLLVLRAKTKKMKKILILLAACLLLGGCSGDGGSSPYMLEGAWVMQEVRIPQGDTFSYNTSEGTRLRLYEGDSVMNEFQLSQTGKTLVVRPSEWCGVRLIGKGSNEWVYLEEEEPRPLTVVDDSTITIQRMGRVYTWRRRADIDKDWGEEMRGIAESNLKKLTNQPGEQPQYVLSAKERELTFRVNWLIVGLIALTVLGLIAVQMGLVQRREKRRLQLQISQIQEMHVERPQMVRQAIASVESDYFASEEYNALVRRIATGQILKTDEWQEIENQLRKVYPGFTAQLRSLYDMSELQYQVCLLIKFRITPKDIAAVLARDMSTISTVRSRLYKKVFGREGGAREWDEFIHSIGA